MGAWSSFPDSLDPAHQGIIGHPAFFLVLKDQAWRAATLLALFFNAR
jgi:hypothetical protein